MSPITDAVPKSLIEIEGKPFLLWQLEYLLHSGIRKVVLNVCHMEDQIREVVRDNPIKGLSVTIVSEGNSPVGTAAALKLSLPILGRKFFVIYGDCLPLCFFSHVEERFNKSGKKALMTIYHVNDNRGNVAYENGEFLSYNKFEHDERMEYRDYGIGILSASILKNTTFDDLAHVYNSLGSNITGYVVGLRPYEIGSFNGLERTRGYFRYYKAVS